MQLFLALLHNMEVAHKVSNPGKDAVAASLKKREVTKHTT
jgi:hypothetical protein